MESSRMYCTQCGKRGIDIPRPGRRRKSGHLKRLWCPNCEKIINHVEITEFGEYNINWFIKEYQMKNFNTDGTRKIPLNEFKNYVYNKEEN